MQSRDSCDVISNVIFDLDGTLIDSAPSILECFRLTFISMSYPLSMTLDHSLIGPPLREAIKLLSNEQDSLRLDRLVGEFKNQYDSGVCNSAPAYQGVEELLTKLKKSNKRVFIVTNKRHNPTIKIITHLGWSNLIQDIYTVDYPSVDLKKKSLVIQQLILDYSLEKAETCYVGDRLDDYDAAHANSLKFIHASWGYGADDFSVPYSNTASSVNHLNAFLIQ